MTDDRNETCRIIYDEYQRITEKIKAVTELNTFKRGEHRAYKMIDSNDILRKEELRKKMLESCEDFMKSLSASERFEIENG